MAAPAYRHLARQLNDRDLFMQAELIRETIATPGWKFLVDSIGEHESKMLHQLLNETTKAEEIPRLRGLVQGLRSIHEAAESILAFADERADKARSAAAQENTHV
jgi:hypothetical protein